MVEAILIIAAAIAAFISIEIAYNTLIYKQPKQNRRTGLFVGITTGCLAVLGLISFLVSKIQKVPFLGNVVNIIDTPLDIFIKETPIVKVVAIALGLLAGVFIWFLIRGTLAFARKRKEYELYEESKKSEEPEVQETVVEPVDVVVEEAVKEPEEVVTEKIFEEDPVHFLPNLSLSDIQVKDPISLKNTYVASKGKMQIGEVKSGYVAIYRDVTGMNQLKRILSENSIDISGIRPEPTIVIFDNEKIKAMNFKKWYQKVKG